MLAPLVVSLLMRGVRQGCPASGYLCTVAFEPVSGWLMSAVLPPEPQRPWFLQRCACAYADDFALATASLRESCGCCFRDDWYRHRHAPYPQKVHLDPVRERDYPPAI